MSNINRITKSKNKIISGCLGGVSELLGLDPFWVRLGFLGLSMLTLFPGILIYIVLSLSMSKE